MAEIFVFPEEAERLNLDGMGYERLSACLQTVRAQIAQWDEQEPADMGTEEYETWGDRHEELEDLADELRDRLDGLGGPDA